MISRTTFRFVVALPGLALLLVALRSWSVARHQCDASGARLTGSHGSEVTAKNGISYRAPFYRSGTRTVCHGQQREGGINQ